jgi:hypothetical protein
MISHPLLLISSHSRADREKFENIRDGLVSDSAARQRLREMGVLGGEVDKRIWAAFKHACKINKLIHLL